MAKAVKFHIDYIKVLLAPSILNSNCNINIDFSENLKYFLFWREVKPIQVVVTTNVSRPSHLVEDLLAAYRVFDGVGAVQHHD